MSSIVNTSLSTDTDLNLGIVNIRVDSITKNVQFSTTGPSVDILYSVKIYDPSSHSFNATSGSQTNVSTIPINLYNSVVNILNQFVEVQIIDLVYGMTHVVYVSCNDDVTPTYFAILTRTT
jgi:hypothetical protein